MTPEQIKHYAIGGVFRATFNPKTLDLDDSCMAVVGNKVEVYQNCETAPIQDGEYGKDWEGQFRFNCREFPGWIPEEDLSDLEILDEYVDSPEPIFGYVYRMTFTDQSKLEKNFGKGYGEKAVPFVVYRNYPRKMHTYVLGLSDPIADEIAVREYNNIDATQTDWEIIHPKR